MVELGYTPHMHTCGRCSQPKKYNNIKLDIFSGYDRTRHKVSQTCKFHKNTRVSEKNVCSLVVIKMPVLIRSRACRVQM